MRVLILKRIILTMEKWRQQWVSYRASFNRFNVSSPFEIHFKFRRAKRGIQWRLFLERNPREEERNIADVTARVANVICALWHVNNSR